MLLFDIEFLNACHNGVVGRIALPQKENEDYYVVHDIYIVDSINTKYGETCIRMVNTVTGESYETDADTMYLEVQGFDISASWGDGEETEAETLKFTARRD